MLSREQSAFYDENGYLLIEDAVTPAQLDKLRTITADLIEQSRTLTTSDDRFDLDEGHSAERPRLTRIKLPPQARSLLLGCAAELAHDRGLA